VNDVDAARKDLIARGAKVSEVFHFAGGPFNDTGKNPRVSGRRLGWSFLLFVRVVRGPGWERLLAPGNKTRLPGREWKSTADVARLAELPS